MSSPMPSESIRKAVATVSALNSATAPTWAETSSQRSSWLEYGSQSADSIKTETQIGYHFPAADVSIGYREEFGGEFDEQAVLLAVTVRR